MNRILLALMIVLCSVASAQVEVVYPYNPDGNADGMISAPDLLDFLPIFGGEFNPLEITVNGEGLNTVLEEMQSEQDSLSSSNTQLEAQVLQFTSTVDSLNSENNILTSAVQLLSDSIESIEIEMAALLDSVVISPQIEYLTNYCAYFPNSPNNPYRYVDQGCTLCMIRAVSYNMYGGILRLNSDGYEEGGLMTIFYSARDGNSGTWQIETSTDNGWTNITSVGPFGGNGWIGAGQMWSQTFQFNGSSWGVIE